ncbi:hypothetical protein DFJ58DRAFT_843259 [Suillus subalutaceus]|uniref:uncharacterized protein n=1 Tax=Suillus subalutaceus TaxID=48586 RepID=UPI001B86CE70|nr:uncharacterized protein DFJ58DRAFT_843259 [Suillus subalutaceus]KAG1847165.1 hypothetical protein DFJ58DRAFT_843259 [Suillus subalutaceus]
MSEHNIVYQSRTRDPDSPEATSREAIAGESSIQRRGNIRRFLGKFQNGVTKQISAEVVQKRLKDSRSPDANHAGAQNIEDTPHGVEQGAGPRLDPGARNTPEHMAAPSGPPITVEPAPRAHPDLGTAEDFPAVYGQAIRSFDSAVERFADVCALSLIRG